MATNTKTFFFFSSIPVMDQKKKGGKGHWCNDCRPSKSFANRANFNRHRREVHRDGNFQCEYCPRKYSRWNTLQDHQYIRHREETYKKYSKNDLSDLGAEPDVVVEDSPAPKR